MKEILLTQNKVALVDDDWYEILSQFKWYAVKDSNTFYARRDIYPNGKRTILMMHRVILGEAPPGKMPEHKDGNGLNNQRENLSFVTCRENALNRIRKGGSKYPGVSWHKASKKWQAQIGLKSKNFYLGTFSNEEDAYEAYKRAFQQFNGGKI